jgi:hypothetical protein
MKPSAPRSRAILKALEVSNRTEAVIAVSAGRQALKREEIG